MLRKRKKRNEARFKIFEKKHLKCKQPTDLSLLQPCKRTFHLHLKRANYVAKIWKSADIAMVDLPSPTQHRWNEEGDIFWTDDMFPDNLNDYVAVNEDAEEEDFEETFSMMKMRITKTIMVKKERLRMKNSP